MRRAGRQRAGPSSAPTVSIAGDRHSLLDDNCCRARRSQARSHGLSASELAQWPHFNSGSRTTRLAGSLGSLLEDQEPKLVGRIGGSRVAGPGFVAAARNRPHDRRRPDMLRVRRLGHQLRERNRGLDRPSRLVGRRRDEPGRVPSRVVPTGVMRPTAVVDREFDTPSCSRGRRRAAPRRDRGPTRSASRGRGRSSGE